MPYIAPNSDIRLLSDIPIDIQYTRTLWFPNITTQTSYFTGKNKLYLTKQYYVRKGRGSIKIQAASDSIYDCNYMMFKNTSYQNKWFYAFITGIEYVNNTTSIIYYEIDLLQTWFFEMELGQCFIKRQHSTTDVAGDNLIPEGLETGEYIYNSNSDDYRHVWDNYDILVLSSFSSTHNPDNTWTFTPGSATGLFGNIVTGLNRRLFRNAFQTSTIDTLKSFLNAVINRGYSDGIVAIIMTPSEFHGSEDNLITVTHSVPRINNLHGYIPRNNKLLTYPYAFIECQNCEGATGIFRQEFFTNDSVAGYVRFLLEFSESAAPIACCTPVSYKGVQYYNRSESIYINNFVMCSWNVDLFKAYVAQSLTAKIGESLVDDVKSGVKRELSHNLTEFEAQKRELDNRLMGRSGGPSPHSNTPRTNDQFSIGDFSADMVRSPLFPPAVVATTIAAGVTGGAQVAANIYNNLAEMYSKSVAPPHNTGANTPDFLTSILNKGFWFFHRTITPEFASKIDKFFDMYGYAQHTVGIPNLHARLRWTYIQTIGAVVKGEIPTEAVSFIEGVLNNGITFWSDTDYVGDYSQNNPII